MIKYKIDILESLKNAGYSTYKMRKDKILGESVLQQIRRGEPVSWNNLDTICGLLNCQPGDLLEFVRNEVVQAE